MAQAIRNFCLARGQISAAGAVFVYTAPPNASVIVKEVRLTNATATAGTTRIVSRNRSNLVEVNITGGALTPSPGGLNWSGWTVLNDDDLLMVETSQALSYWISGAVLPLAEGQLAPALEQPVSAPPLGLPLTTR